MYYVGAMIINYLDVTDIFQKNVVATRTLTNVKNFYFRLGPDLSWKFKQHLHSFSRHSDSVVWPQIPHSQLLDMVLVVLFRI